MFNPFLWWKCCGSGQRDFINVVQSYFVLPTAYIPRDTFFTLWFVYMGNYYSAYREWWVVNFGLTEGTVPDGEGGEIEVYFLDLTIWGIIVSFLLFGDVSLIPPCLFTSGVFSL